MAGRHGSSVVKHQEQVNNMAASVTIELIDGNTFHHRADSWLRHRLGQGAEFVIGD
jgi:hypothetical protein